MCCSRRDPPTRHSRRCLSVARMAAGATAMQRCSREALDARQAPSAPSRYGQTAAVVRRGRTGRFPVPRSSVIGPKDTGQPATIAERRVARPRKRKNPGDDLFSRKAALSVSSALESLTSVFGMGTGMASPLESPGFVASGRVRQRHARGPRWTRRGAGMRSSISDESSRIDHDPQPLTPGQLLKRSSPRPLVPLSFIRHRTSTCGLSNRWSPCGLTRLTRWGTSSRGELRT